MNETTRRFLTGVLERVPESRIVDVRLFPALRQGGLESGIAVLAVEQGFDAIPDATAATDPVDFDEPVDADAVVISASTDHEVEVHLAVADVISSEADALDEHVADPNAVVPVELHMRDETALERQRVLEVASDGVGVADVPSHAMADATASDVECEVDAEVTLADVGVAEPAETVALGDILALPAPAPAIPLRDPTERLAILCARYRLVLKGPDRGKWELEVVHQADAPLATLDRVIAGVVRRSGETAEPERFTAETLRARLEAPPWVEGAAA